ncbi:flagellin [Cytobacillus firmus]|uniref:flagellin N-terminal helical domain-containing protein n=1 Tax=Cytobacillus firmus TaxID=1399 RepID=UPI001C8D5300|nr:flagellin [Cytobacillus firmus]MBX9974390.1 flagellin [Cytobacillus firmus]
MRINHNIAALNTYRQLNSASTAQSKSMEKLSSGLRINKAGDDAAGLAISEKMRGQIRGLDMASKNSQDGISLIQTAEGALNETHDILQRMRELAVQAGNDTNTESDRKEIQKEINQMTSEINRIGNTTEFNTQKLLNGDKDGAAVDAVAAVAGEYKVTVGTSNITIDGKTFTYDATGGGTTNFKNAAELATLIAADADLKDKYTASDDSGALKLVQKTGEETATAPTVSGGTLSTTKAGVDKVDAVAADPTKSLKFQIGANENQSLTLDISDMRAEALGLTSTGTGADRGVTDGTSNEIKEQALSVLTHDDAAATVTTIQAAIDKVSAERSKLGANQNRLEHTINNLSTSSENLTAAESRIRDVDMAKEMMNQTKNSILSQAAQAMLAQANQQPQGVLQLLR